MAIAYVNSTEGSASSASSATVTFASTTAGHLLILTVGISSRAPEVKRRALYAEGWRMFVNDYADDGSFDFKLNCWWKIATGAESGSQTVSLYSGTYDIQLGMIAYSGVDQQYPMADVVYEIDNSSSTTVGVPGMDCVLDNSLAVHIYSSRAANATWTPASGFTLRLTAATSGLRPTIGVAEKDVSRGAISSTTATSSSTGNNIGLLLTLNPEGAGSFWTTPWKYGTSFSNVVATAIGLSDGENWQTTSNAGASDDTRSEAGGGSLTSSFTSDMLKCVGFDLSVPAGATIIGVEVEAEGRFYFTSSTSGDATRLSQVLFGLYRNNVAEAYYLWFPRAFSGIYVASPSSSNPADETFTMGGPGCMWAGASWVKSDIENANFGCYLVANVTSGEDPSAGNNKVQIDGVRMRVWFIPPALLGDII
jgi:hypothetical protein